MNTKKKSEGFVGVHIGAGQHSEVSYSSSYRSWSAFRGEQM